MGIPSWLMFLIAILVVPAILFLIGMRVHVGGFMEAAATPAPHQNYWWLITHPFGYFFSGLEPA